MLLEREKSSVLLIDVQERLTPNVLSYETLVARCYWLLNLARALNVPYLISEQYPQGLGPTVEALGEFISPKCTIQKVSFSTYRAHSFQEHWAKNLPSQIILAGIETHVCVLQTALDLAENYEVFVVVDAVSSRYELDHQYGLARMQQMGIQLITAEMVFFEWLRQAGTEEFKTLSKLFLPRKI